MYSAVAEYRAFASAVGATVPVADADCTIQLLKASQYIDSKEEYLRGVRADRDQSYAYPRSGLKINGFDYLDNEIPPLVKKCEMALALEINAGVDLYANSAILPVIKERVEGAVEVGYASPTKVETRSRESVAMSLLSQLMRPAQMSIPLVRA